MPGILLAIIAADLAYYGVVVDIGRLRTHNPQSTAFIRYRQRQWEKSGKKIAIRKEWVPLSRISSYVQKSVLIAEDDKFYNHDGFDYESIQKAIEKNLKSGRFKMGASTITQQLAKNLYLSPRKNPIRKVNEAILTWRIERTLKKSRILEIYLNVVEWGEGVFGVEAASRRYFGVSAKELTPSQASLLAAVLPNPLRYNLSRPSRYVLRRAELIQRVMSRRGVAVSNEKKSGPPPEKASILSGETSFVAADHEVGDDPAEGRIVDSILFLVDQDTIEADSL